jgi:uncharacterized protein YjbI with pentapeptide repeats
VDQEPPPQERTLELVSRLLPNRRPSAEQGMWAIRIAVAVAIVLGVLALIGNWFGITLWDWLKVLALPITVGVAVPSLNWLQRKREERLALQRSQDDALEGYLNQMSQLLIDKEHPLQRCLPHDKFTFVARSRTLTVLSKLDAERKVRVVQFLYEAGLILDDTGVFQLCRAADLNRIDLSTANLRAIDLGMAVLKDAKLLYADLSQTNLRQVDFENANLTRANLKWSDLRGANLRSAELPDANLKWSKLSAADLTKADLRRCYLSEGSLEGTYLKDTNLSEANLLRANLHYAYLNNAHLNNANLSEADLRNADLREADLSGASLCGTNLSEANLTKATLSEAALSEANLTNATMPNGQKYEDWVKDKQARGKDKAPPGSQ